MNFPALCRSPAHFVLTFTSVRDPYPSVTIWSIIGLIVIDKRVGTIPPFYSSRHPMYKYNVTTAKIPSTENFRLDLILAHLGGETNEAVQLVLNVSKNYQVDLREVIKLSLKREQKIQQKNVKLAKMARVLAKRMKLATPLLSQIASVAGEVDDLQGVAATTSDRLKTVMERVHRLEFDTNKYPKLAELIKKKKETEVGMTHDAPTETIDAESSGGSCDQPVRVYSPLSVDPLDQSILESPTYSRKTVDQSNSRTVVTTSVQSVQPRQPVFTSSMTRFEPLPDSPVTIPSPATPPFNHPFSSPSSMKPPVPVPVVVDDPMSPVQFEQFMTKNISKYRQRKSRQTSADSPHHCHNPINLLYSSLISHPNYIDTTPRQNPFASVLPIKLAPTATQTFLTSHFKKLRINGNPITSNTFKNTQQTTSPCCCRVMSPAREALAQLDRAEHVATPSPPSISEDVWTTVDSLGLELLPRKLVVDEYFSKSDSPTPKHRPSHHTLKPKRSILKSSISNSKVAVKTNPGDKAKYMAPLALSEINLAYDNNAQTRITSFSVQGTILLADDIMEMAPPLFLANDDDAGSIHSISKLKGLLEEIV